MNKLIIKIGLVVIIVLAPFATYSFSGDAVSVEAAVGARAYQDTQSMCRALLDQRLSKSKSNIPVLELAVKDAGFRGGFKNLADYSVAFGSAANVSQNALAVGVVLDEANKLLQSRSYRLKVLLESDGYKKAIKDCAAEHSVPEEDVNKLVRSVLGDIDSAALVSTRIASFVVSGVIFNKAMDLTSKSLKLKCDHWFNKRRGLVMGGLGVGMVGGAIGYGTYLNEQMKQAAEEVSKKGVGSLIGSLKETRVSANLTSDVQNYVILVSNYNAFVKSEGLDADFESAPPELIAKLDRFMAKKPVIQTQVNQLRSLKNLSEEETQYLNAAESLLGMVNAHESYWRLWFKQSSHESANRKLMLEVLFEHQSILQKPVDERTSDDFLRLDVLRAQIVQFDYESK